MIAFHTFQVAFIIHGNISRQKKSVGKVIPVDDAVGAQNALLYEPELVKHPVGTKQQLVGRNNHFLPQWSQEPDLRLRQSEFF